MSKWAIVARLTKAKTHEGDLFVRSAEGLPFLLEEGMEVVFVPPVLKVPRSGVVESIEEKGNDLYQVSFSTIDSIDLSEQLVGHYCLVKKADLPADYDTNDSFEVIGYTLKDSEGSYIGIVHSVEENPAHPLLVVEYDQHDVRIPLVDELLVSLDEEEKCIVMDLPAGILSL